MCCHRRFPAVETSWSYYHSALNQQSGRETRTEAVARTLRTPQAGCTQHASTLQPIRSIRCPQGTQPTRQPVRQPDPLGRVDRVTSTNLQSSLPTCSKTRQFDSTDPTVFGDSTRHSVLDYFTRVQNPLPNNARPNTLLHYAILFPLHR